jgi:predicted enzyme related to lactoylglutathione lyase
MKEVTEHPPGTFCWVELASSDAVAAKKFYSSLFDWDIADQQVSPDMVYTIFQIDGKDVAAAYQMNEKEKSQSPPYWLSYISTTKVEDSMEKARSLGGNILGGPIDVMDAGRLAVIQDPTGAVFAVWQAAKHIGVRYAGEPRTLGWNELLTTDDQKAGEFYTQLFGWGKELMPSLMKDSPYTLFQIENRPVGGMLKTPAEWGKVPPHWLVYFRVDDTDQTVQKVTKLGGRVIVPPTDIPNVGRFSILTDPQGADFAVIKMFPRNQTN